MTGFNTDNYGLWCFIFAFFLIRSHFFCSNQFSTWKTHLISNWYQANTDFFGDFSQSLIIWSDSIFSFRKKSLWKIIEHSLERKLLWTETRSYPLISVHILRFLGVNDSASYSSYGLLRSLGSTSTSCSYWPVKFRQSLNSPRRK